MWGEIMITIEGFLFGCFLVTAIYHTYLFIFYKKNYAALYFALITYASTVLTLIKQTDWLIRYKVILIIFIIVPVFYVEFTKHMYPIEFRNPFSRGLGRLIYTYASVFTLLVMVLPMDRFVEWVAVFQKVSFPVNMSLIIYLFVQLFRASRKKRSDARILLVGFLVLFITAIVIYMVPGSMMTQNNPVGALGILLLYSGTLARRYAKAYHTCESIVEERTEELNKINTELVRLVNRDALTGAFSRRYITEKLEVYFGKAKEANEEFSIISLDIDHFKHVNDRFGHPMGDQVLVGITEVIQSQLISDAFLGRVGGEEFLIILPTFSLEQGVEKAEAIRKQVSAKQFSYNRQVFTVSCSMGVVAYDESMQNYDDMMKGVDQLLYKAKAEGRNQVCYA